MNICKTISTFWDCECKTDYIHSFMMDSCPRCNMTKADAADSRLLEVVSKMYREIVIETITSHKIKTAKVIAARIGTSLEVVEECLQQLSLENEMAKEIITRAECLVTRDDLDNLKLFLDSYWTIEEREKFLKIIEEICKEHTLMYLYRYIKRTLQTGCKKDFKHYIIELFNMPCLSPVEKGILLTSIKQSWLKGE